MTGTPRSWAVSHTAFSSSAVRSDRPVSGNATASVVSIPATLPQAGQNDLLGKRKRLGLAVLFAINSVIASES